MNSLALLDMTFFAPCLLAQIKTSSVFLLSYRALDIIIVIDKKNEDLQN